MLYDFFCSILSFPFFFSSTVRKVGAVYHQHCILFSLFSRDYLPLFLKFLVYFVPPPSAFLDYRARDFFHHYPKFPFLPFFPAFMIILDSSGPDNLLPPPEILVFNFSEAAFWFSVFLDNLDDFVSRPKTRFPSRQTCRQPFLAQ